MLVEALYRLLEFGGKRGRLKSERVDCGLGDWRRGWQLLAAWVVLFVGKVGWQVGIKLRWVSHRVGRKVGT